MNSDLIKQANNAGYNLRKRLLKKYANIKIETVLQKEIQTLLKAVNDNNYNLFLETITPIYTKYEIDMPSVFFEMLNDDEHFIKILSAYIFGLKGAYKQPKGHEIEIDGELCYDIKNICDKLDIHKNTIYRWLKEGKIKRANSNKTGHIYIRKSDIDNLLTKED
ncbi:helix-turn-helix domain-containing protein [Brachyspira aalborgi]|uniref:DNA-binding protein n=1 Tax=Brachyspira aalborgi TaxID=29522 RepID=A0ABY3K6R9_9SPIR|nr:helix-turn-helix domain-containing protein [Brachyspira aalborgi]TXJ31174.1 DNA-binding protein [Brachyspira aalborgi]TXJ40064.1 DNA-binding protein [Brachyspira aalborgi]